MDPVQLVKSFAEREIVSEEIVTDKRLIIDYDRRRNSNREALGSIKNKLSKEQKLWINVDNLFIRLPKEAARSIIQQDQQDLDAEISNLRTKLKTRANDLERLSGGDGHITAMFEELKGMTSEDLYKITQQGGKGVEKIIEGE